MVVLRFKELFRYLQHFQSRNTREKIQEVVIVQKWAAYFPCGSNWIPCAGEVLVRLMQTHANIKSITIKPPRKGIPDVLYHATMATDIWRRLDSWDHDVLSDLHERVSRHQLISRRWRVRKIVPEGKIVDGIWDRDNWDEVHQLQYLMEDDEDIRVVRENIVRPNDATPRATKWTYIHHAAGFLGERRDRCAVCRGRFCWGPGDPLLKV